MKNKKLSPVWQAVIATGIVIMLAVCAIAAGSLIMPSPATLDLTKVDPASARRMASIAGILILVYKLNCPAALIVGVVTFFVARGRQKSQAG